MNLQAVVELVDKMSGPLGKINGVLGEFAKGMSEGMKAEMAFQKQTEQTAKSTTSLADGLKLVGEALAAIGAAKAIFDGFAASIAAADQMDDLAEKLGVSSGKLKGLAYAAEQSGASLNTLTSGLDRLSRSAAMSEEESSKQAEAFEALGISTQKANGDLKSSEELFYEIADAFKGLEDGPQKSALAFAIFGGAAKDLMPLLNGGSEGINKLAGEIQELGGLTEEQAKRFNAASASLNDNISRIVLIFKNMFDVMSNELVPVLDIVISEIIRAYKEGGILRNVVDGITTVFRDLFVPVLKITITVIDAFVSAVQIAGKGLGALVAMIVSVAKGDFAAAKTVWAEYKNDVNKIANEHVNLTQRLNDSGKAVKKMGDDAEKGADKTKNSLNGLGKKAKEVKSELEGMVKALKFENQTFNMDDAAKKAAEARAKYEQDIANKVPKGKADALLAEALAQIKVNEALKAGAEAQRNYEAAGKTVADMDYNVKVLEMEAKMIGASAEERERAIQAMADEAEIRKITNGLTDEAAGKISEEIKALQKRRDAAKQTIEDNKRLEQLTSGTWAEQSKKAMDDVEFLYQAYLDGRIKSEEQYVEAVKIRLGSLKDNTKEELDEMTEFWMEAARGMQNTMSSFFFDIMQGKMDNLGDRFKQMLDKMVADALAAKLAEALFGTGFTSTGKMGGWVGSAMSWLGGLFGGARASGGPVQAGKMYLVGEKGPEPFIPGVSGTVLPNSSLKSMAAGQTYHVNITAMDSQDVRRALEKDMRWLADGVNKASRAYNLGV